MEPRSSSVEPGYLVRVLLVGASGSGKTSLVLRFHANSFDHAEKSTIGVDYRAKNLRLQDGTDIKLQLWDTAGQERFRSMTSAFYHRAGGVVVVFDVANRESFEALPSWLKDVEENAPERCHVVLCGNKTDLDQTRFWQVTESEAKDFAVRRGLDLYFTSAQTGSNVEGMFTDVTTRIVRDGGMQPLHEVRGTNLAGALAGPATTKSAAAAASTDGVIVRNAPASTASGSSASGGWCCGS